MGAATLAMALGLGGLMHSRTTVAGTALPLADADAATYGVSAVYQLDDTTYYVVGSKQGFQSEVQAGVTLDRDGNVLDVKILAQAETDSLGAQCENPEFTAQYQGAAPFTLAGKRYTVTDPATGTAFAAAGSAETDAAPAEAFDPAAWRAGDTSPESEATRKMYEAGLTLSALNDQPMDDALIPPMDNSAEAVARRKLYAACLSKSAQDGEKQAVPYADWSAEKQAEYKLQAADLTTQGSVADTVSADMTQVDALSGATITSTAVTDIVNNSYFYVTEVLCAE
jgi:Na+-translocating ferredoxin:NAD+ oxidoreductase RnfG subunit